MQENSQDQFYISNSVLLILKIAEGSLGGHSSHSAGRWSLW